MSVRINNLSYKYPHNEKDALQNVNLEIETGNLVVLLGNNGCGKTTLIKSIVGLFKCTNGSIFINDIDINRLSIKERAKQMAYVSQKVNKLEDVLVKDYLTFGFNNDLRFYERPSAKHYSMLEEYAKKLNIMHLLNKKIDEISGGERQIVSICAALLQNTSIILLDEPTSALDLKNQHMVLSTLKDISNKENKTMILSSHNPNHALFLNSKVAIMKDGNILKYGEAKDAIKVEVLRQIYGDSICYSNQLEYDEISFK